jgi:hypothetical protein
MNYTPGHHLCNPNEKIKYSNKPYILKHLNFLGLEYIINKITQRYKRSIDAQKSGMSTHYTNDINKIKNNYNNKLKNAIEIKFNKILYILYKYEYNNFKKQNKQY